MPAATHDHVVPATAHCHRCGAVTASILADLRCGHRGCLCAECHSLRRGRPYVPRNAILEPEPQPAAKGANHARPN